MEKKKKKDDGNDWIEHLFEIILIIALVCAAYFTKPSDSKIKDKVEQEVTKLYFKDHPTPTITYDIDDFFVLKITNYCAENGDRVYAGRAIALFGFVWVP